MSCSCLVWSGPLRRQDATVSGALLRCTSREEGKRGMGLQYGYSCVWCFWFVRGIIHLGTNRGERRNRCRMLYPIYLLDLRGSLLYSMRFTPLPCFSFFPKNPTATQAAPARYDGPKVRIGLVSTRISASATGSKILSEQ